MRRNDGTTVSIHLDRVRTSLAATSGLIALAMAAGLFMAIPARA